MNTSSLLKAALALAVLFSSATAALAQGKTNPEIAVILQLSARTVEKHMERILEKIGVENRTAAAVVAAQADSIQA